MQLEIWSQPCFTLAGQLKAGRELSKAIPKREGESVGFGAAVSLEP